jgi:hypothetical protein
MGLLQECYGHFTLGSSAGLHILLLVFIDIFIDSFYITLKFCAVAKFHTIEIP